MAYVDGYVIPLPKKNLAAYRRMSAKACRVWMDHGALEYRECVGDDLKVKGVVPFTRTAGCKAGETAVFSWVVYKSRAHRDRVNAAVMKDPRIEAMTDPRQKPPFDCKRLAFGGFKVIVASRKARR